MKKYRMQLIDTVTGDAISASGGKCYVATAGGAAKAALLNAAGATLANPVSLTAGVIEFYVDDSVNSVDLYVQAPSGHAVILKGVPASGPNAIFINKSTLNTVLVVPFSATDSTAAAETNTGFTVPTRAAVLPAGIGVEVRTVDPTETLDVGTLSTDSGDADGFLAAVSVATAGFIKGTLANGALTLGALLFVQDSANAGDEAPEPNTTSTGKAITYTLTAGSDTAAGFICIPMQLSPSSI
jgi:hypothetical protein